MSKILVGVHLDAERVAKLDRLAKGGGLVAPTTRAKQASFMLARALDAVEEPPPPFARRNAVYRGPAPDVSAGVTARGAPPGEIDPSHHEGARLKAARLAAKRSVPAA